mmetsp:Transcript_31805/g.53662  ORF Transcript_31805/g.53662 Transcript_31805/m.53662 type:complete len:175 (-) Transcript_31805:272-796(-)|eukprot:CAMPEP_0174962758 /NCGR_PEP_ID=MMETSP0004_2-20121128/4954_1 /TAXON_ID=420556 /ORGANISM="Ochromonas sp., Strain CCMP1393" /LENGTH=174 /DNA_ID=CAMNT_0016211311 /DNA_START=134 /DNA_END=658 /DNA_ORIENTATION=+
MKAFIVGYIVCFFASIHLAHAVDNSAFRPSCYTGSSLYETVVQNCNDKDPSYTDEWYCATMEICESFIDKARVCAVTKGCATKEECSTSSTTSGVYDSTTVDVGGTNPAGMTITTTCCEAKYFDDDDEVAIDYSAICNSANRRVDAGSSGTTMTALLFVAVTTAIMVLTGSGRI